VSHPSLSSESGGVLLQSRNRSQLTDTTASTVLDFDKQDGTNHVESNTDFVSLHVHRSIADSVEQVYIVESSVSIPDVSVWFGSSGIWFSCPDNCQDGICYLTEKRNC
jgi:hypothetical protein